MLLVREIAKARILGIEANIASRRDGSSVNARFSDQRRSGYEREPAGDLESVLGRAPRTSFGVPLRSGPEPDHQPSTISALTSNHSARGVVQFCLWGSFIIDHGSGASPGRVGTA